MPWRWILPLVWLVAWSLAARAFWGASRDQNAEADRIGMPLTDVEPGADVRVEARVGRGPRTESPFSKREGVAILQRVAYVTSYIDSQDKTAWDSARISSRILGPKEVWLDVSTQHFVLPMDLFEPDWRTWPSLSKQLSSLPAELQVSPDDVERAKERCRGKFDHFTVDEWVIEEGRELFVVGHLSARDPHGTMFLEPDPVLKHIELIPGKQADAVVKRRGSSRGLRVAGWIVLGLGFLPTLILTVLLVRSRLRPKSAAGTS